MLSTDIISQLVDPKGYARARAEEKYRQIHPKQSRSPLGEAVCPQCQKQFHSKKREQVYCCKTCSNMAIRKTNRPSKDELQAMLATMSCLAVAKKYDVGNTTIRRWAKQYGI